MAENAGVFEPSSYSAAALALRPTPTAASMLRAQLQHFMHITCRDAKLQIILSTLMLRQRT